MNFLKRSAICDLQFWSSVLLGSSITYFGLLHAEPRKTYKDTQDTDRILEDMGYSCQWNILKYIDIKGGWLSKLSQDFDISFWQESVLAMISADMLHKFSTVLSSPWLCDTGGTKKLLEIIQEYRSRKTRVLLTEVIATLNLPEGADFQDILSSCNDRILTGLARMESLDQNIWNALENIQQNRQQENVISPGSSMENDLRSLLLSLPLTGLDACTTWFTKSAIFARKSAKKHNTSLSWSFLEDSNLSFASNFSSMLPEQVELFYLKALSRHSMIPSHRQIMVEKGILPILLQELELRQKNVKIQWEIGRILGNLTLEETTHADMVNQGTLQILRSWLFSEDLTMSSHAARALANLDRDFIPDESYEEGVYLLHPDTRQSSDIAKDIIFVHGLRGGPLQTWRQEGTGRHLTREQCWPKAWLVKDFPHSRVLMVEYDSSLSKWVAECPNQPETCSLASRSKEIMKKLRIAGVGKRPVVWVTHSMGGLLVKQMLLNAKDDPQYRSMCDKTKGIVFYSTPHRGSPLASYSSQARYLLLPSVEVKELCQGCPYLISLHSHFMELLDNKHVDCLSIGETIPVQLSWMFNSVLVSKDSSDLGVGDHFMLDVDHINVCKPNDPADLRYTHLKNFIQNILDHL